MQLWTFASGCSVGLVPWRRKHPVQQVEQCCWAQRSSRARLVLTAPFGCGVRPWEDMRPPRLCLDIQDFRSAPGSALMQLQLPSFNLVSASATHFEGARGQQTVRALASPTALCASTCRLSGCDETSSASSASRTQCAPCIAQLTPKTICPQVVTVQPGPQSGDIGSTLTWPWQMTTLCMWHALVVSVVLQHARAIGVSLHLIPRPRAPCRLVLFTEAHPASSTPLQ